MKTYWGSGGIAPRILYLGARWGNWSASRPSRFTARETAPRAHWIRGWVGPRAGLDAVVKGKIPNPCPDHPAHSPAQLTICGPGGGGDGWKRLHNEEIRNLNASPNIIRVIKSRRMRWVEYVARIG
jgi:hypothetical protein